MTTHEEGPPGYTDRWGDPGCLKLHDTALLGRRQQCHRQLATTLEEGSRTLLLQVVGPTQVPLGLPGREPRGYLRNLHEARQLRSSVHPSNATGNWG